MKYQIARKNSNIDLTSGVSGNESIAELGEIFESNNTKWQEMGILLPKKTPTNRTFSRNEKGWCYIASQWEHFLTLIIKSEETGVPVDVLMKEAAEKERLRQKRKREVIKTKKAAELNKDADRSEIRPTQRQGPNLQKQFGASAAVAARLDNLLS